MNVVFVSTCWSIFSFLCMSGIVTHSCIMGRFSFRRPKQKKNKKKQCFGCILWLRQRRCRGIFAWGRKITVVSDHEVLAVLSYLQTGSTPECLVPRVFTFCHPQVFSDKSAKKKELPDAVLFVLFPDFQILQSWWWFCWLWVALCRSVVVLQQRIQGGPGPPCPKDFF